MTDALHLAPAAYAVALAVVAIGAAVQGTVGFGANLLVVPVVAVLEPAAVPVVPMLLVLPLALAMVRREPRRVDRRAVALLMVGRLPGTLLGAWVVAHVAADALTVLCGVGVLVAVVTSILTTTVQVTPTTTVAAGAASGVLGTATSIGGPPLALLFQHREGPVLRATLAATFVLGTVLSVSALVVAGVVEGWQVWLALALLPGTAAGVAASGGLARRLDAGWLRPAVLTFAALTAVVAIVRGVA
jgi:uncharacterized membrane protein YfcA